MNNESHLVYEIMREVGKHGAVYRCNSGSVKLPNGKTFRGMPKGFADVMAVMPGGVVCFLEVKMPRGKTTPQRDKFIERMTALGCRAGVVRSVNEAQAICGIESGDCE